MPVFRAKAHDMGRARGNFADIAIIQGLPRPLMGSPEKCIRCAADTNLPRVCGFLESHPVFHGKRRGFSE